MLHILLLILKIIGIILAAILGILVLLICIVLFVPVRYEAAVKCDGTLESLKAKVTVTWLLRLIRADILYKDGRMRNRIRIAWKKLTNGQKDKEDKKGTSEKREAERNEEKSDEKVSETLEEKNQTDEEVKTVQRTEKTSEEQTGEGTEEKCEKSSEESRKVLESAETCSDQTEQKNDNISSGQNQSSSKKSESLSEKIKNKWESIKASFKNLCEKVKSLLEKKDRIMELLKNETHVAAYQKVKKELFFILKKWKPRKSRIQLHFGFEDPCTTGQVLAVIGIIYPFLGDDLVVEPDFEKQIFKGNIYVKGIVRCSHLAGAAIRLLLSKKVRTTYKDIKDFKL